MRISLPTLTFLLLANACGDTKAPNGKLEFLVAEGTGLLEGVQSYRVDRINKSGKATKVFSGAELPAELDLGESGEYKFRANGLDSSGNVLVRGETFLQEVSALAGAQIPLMLARTDRMTQANGRLEIAPGAYPKAAILGSTALWIWTNLTADSITTDGYNIAYWQHVAPVSGDADFTEVECLIEPCNLKNLLIVGGFYALAIADTWAVLVDEYYGSKEELKLPTGLSAFSDVAGGTVFSGASASALLVGATRPSPASAHALLIDNSVGVSVLTQSIPRAGAAALFEADVGLVIAGGSATGVGVERVAPSGTAFTPLNYPADPVSGAVLIRHDATKVLRVGGKNPDGTLATSVLIDVTCTLPTCEAVPVPNLNLDIAVGRSFYDNETSESIVVGEDALGAAIVYRYSPASSSLVPIAVPAAQQRIHATPIELPNRTVALVGGTLPDNPTSSRSVISVVSF